MGESGSESRSDSQSDFGVKISIQALKGHPFVILEGNDAKKKYVPAPKQSDFEHDDDQSYDSDYEQPSGKNYMPRSAASTLDREWEYQKQTPTVASSSIPPSTGEVKPLSSAQYADTRKPVMSGKSNDVFAAEQKNAKLQSELRKMDSDFENELKERETIVDDLKKIETEKKDLEIALEEAKKELSDIQSESNKNKQILGLTEDDKLNLEEQVSELDAQNRKMRRQIQEMTEDLKDRDVEVEELKFRINSESGAMTEVKTTIGDLEREIKRVKAELNEKTEILSEKELILGDVKEKELKGRLQMEETNSRLDELTNQIRELEKARKQASAEIERKEQEIKNQKSQLKETENQLKREQETCERLKKIKQERDSAMVDMEDATLEQVTEMRRQIEDRQKEVAMLKSKITSLEGEIEHGEERRTEQLNKLLELENDKRLSTQERSALERDYKERERRCEILDEKAKNLDDENAKYIEQIRELNQKNRAIEKEKFDEGLKFEEVNRKLRDSERKIRELERKGTNQAEHDVKLAEIQNEVEEKIRANRRLTENLDKITEKHDMLEDELKKMKGTVKESENRKGQEARRRDQLELELQAKTEVLNQANDKISELEDLLHEKTLSKSTLDREHARVSEALEDERQIRDNAENRVEKLQEQLAVADERYKGLANKLEGISGGKVTDLQPEIEKLRRQLEEKARHLAQAEARVARIQRELEATKSFGPDMDNDTRIRIKNLQNSLEQEKNRADEMQEQMRLQEIRNIEGQAQLVEGDQKVFERELAKMRNIMMEKDRRIHTAEDLICKQKEVIEELTDIQKQSEDAAMNEMHGYMTDTKTQFENMRKKLKDKEVECGKLKEEIESLDQHLEAKDDKISRLKEEKEYLEQSRNEQGNTIDETATLIRELRDKLLESQSDVNKLKRRLEGTVLSKDENEDEMAEILRDKEYLNEQYDVLFSRYNALELDLDDLRNEKDKETIKLAKYEEVIKQYESDMEILKSQVEAAQREAEKQAKAISSNQMDSKNNPLNKELSDMKKNKSELERKLKSQSDELQNITIEHKKTAKKLQDLMVQAENEANKAVGGNEMLNLRIKSLKNQLDISESELDLAQTEKRKIQEENLDKEKEIQIMAKTVSDLRAQLRIAQAASKGAQMEITTI